MEKAIHKPAEAHKKLGEWFATAICGNDILSSSLYVSGIAIIFAGIWAPVVLIFIGFVLFLYKMVYTEVVEALPVNGGAYNCLLNGTSKTIAAIAGITTFLSYVATAVISAKVGVEYLSTILPFSTAIIPATIALLFLFAILVISGIKDSAKVALGIFIFHVVSLTLFLAFGVYHYFAAGAATFWFNFQHTGEIISRQGGFMPALYLAFAASLLGVSGFESSANFVEEQQPGVFRKTLRNMLTGVAIFNPLITLAVLNSLPLDSIASAKDFLLADAARAIGGQGFAYLIAIDAFLVLSGAVLTSYVGVSGLLNRMAGDNCLPMMLRKENKKGSFPRIVLLFFILCSSILILTGGNLLSLAGVYTIAFLSVMSLFAIGNLILKEARSELKRTYKAPVIVVIMAFVATFFGILGNIRIDEQNLIFFELYFIPALLLVLGVIYKDKIIKFALRASRRFPPLYNYIQHQFNDITLGKFVVFIRRPERLYTVLDYINRNETGWNITLVTCQDISNGDPKKSYHEIAEILPALREAGVFPHFTINLIYKNKPFSPQVIEEVAKELQVHTNRIFIGSIHMEHEFDYDALGGVRIIL